MSMQSLQIVGQAMMGDTRGAAITAFSQASTFIAFVPNPHVAFVAQSVVAGTTARLQGDRAEHGIISSVATSLIMRGFGVAGIESHVGRMAAGAMIGGTVSDQVGGKFASGALSGAMQGLIAGWQEGGAHYKTPDSRVVTGVHSSPREGETDKIERILEVDETMSWSTEEVDQAGKDIVKKTEETYQGTSNTEEVHVALLYKESDRRVYASKAYINHHKTEFTYTAPDGYKIFGDYHTHPIGQGEFWSDEDLLPSELKVRFLRTSRGKLLRLNKGNSINLCGGNSACFPKKVF